MPDILHGFPQTFNDSNINLVFQSVLISLFLALKIDVKWNKRNREIMAGVSKRPKGGS